MKQIKKVLSVLLTVIILLSVVTVAPLSASAANMWDWDTPRISLRETKTGTLTSENNEQYLRFSPQSTMIVKVSCTVNNTSFDLEDDDECIMYGAETNCSEAYQNGHHTGTVEEIYRLIRNHDYYLDFRMRDQGDSGSFSVTISEVTAFDSIAYGETKTVNVAEPGDLVMLEFSPQTREYVKCYSSGSADAYAAFVSVDDDSIHLYAADDNGGEDNNFSVTHFMDPESSSTFYYACGVNSGATGNFDVTAKHDTAYDLQLGIPKSGVKKDVDYVFTPSQDMTVQAYTPDDARMSIRSEDNSLSVREDYAVSAQLTAGTTYYVSANNFDYGVDAVTICVKDISTAQPLDGFALTLDPAAVVYNGYDKKPEPTVSDGNITLLKNVDYTAAYSNAGGPGKGTCTVTGKGGYTGTLSKDYAFTYTPIALNTDTTAVVPYVCDQMLFSFTPDSDMSVRYFSTSGNQARGTIYDENLNPLTPEQTGSDANFLLNYDMRAGRTYILGCKFKNGGSGNITVRLEEQSEPIDLADCDVALEYETAYYGHTDRTPKVTVSQGDTLLIKDTDYTVAYADNRDPGTATVTVTGIGNCSGSVTKTFTIYEDTIAFNEDKTVSFRNGTNHYLRYEPTEDMMAKIDVTEGEYYCRSLVRVRDCATQSVVYANKNGGNYSIYCRVFAGTPVYLECDHTSYYEPYFTDERYDYHVRITRLDYTPIALDDTKTVPFSEAHEQHYFVFTPDHDMKAQFYATGTTGKGAYPNAYCYMYCDARGESKSSTRIGEHDFRLIYNLKAGYDYVFKCGFDGFNGSYAVTLEEIETVTDIGGCDVTLSQTEYDYTGAPKTPAVTVKDGDKVLRKEWDYTVDYQNNLNIGTATVTVTGVGAYEGTAQRVFTITCDTISLGETKTVYHDNKHGGQYFLFTPTENVSVILTTTAGEFNNTFIMLNGSILARTSFGSTRIVCDLEAGKTYQVYGGISAVNNEPVPKGSFALRLAQAAVTDISACDVTLDTNSFYFDGTAHKPNVTVMYNGEKLHSGTDYTVTYADNVNIGTAKAIVIGDGEFYGTVEVPFAVAADELELYTAETVNIQNGGGYRTFAITPETDTPAGFLSSGSCDTYAVLYDADMTRLRSDDDSGADKNFKLCYQLKAGNTYYLICKLYNTNATGSFDVTFEENVDPVPMTNCTVELERDSYYFDGLAKTPAVAVKYGDVILRQNRDYTVSYASNTNVGTATVTVTGLRRYTGSLTKKFTIGIEKISVGDVKTALIASAGTMKYYSFTPSENMSVHFYSVGDKNTKGYLFRDDLFQISSTETGGEDDNFLVYARLSAGVSYVFGCRFLDDNATGSFTVKLDEYIEPKDLADCAVTLEQDAFIFDNTAKTPSVTVKDGDKILTENTDYTIAYADNTAAGEATVTVTGTGNYFGTVSKTFTIAYDEIMLGTDRDVTIGKAGELSYYRFVPETDMIVRFFSTGSFDTYGEVLDKQFRPLAENDDDGEDRNFLLTYELKGGTPYLFACKFLSNSARGGFRIRLEQYIPPKPITDCNITLAETSFFFDGTAHQPSVTIKYEDETLVEDTDYTLTYLNNTYVGEATVTVTGVGRFDGSVIKHFLIAYDPIRQDENKTVTISKAGEVKYFSFTPDTDMSLRFISTGGLDPYGTVYDSDLKQLSYDDDSGAGSNFKVIYNVKAHTTYILSCRLYNDETGTFTVRAEDNTMPISDCEITLAQNVFTFDNTAKTPEVTITDGDKTLTPGEDFTVAYADNIRVGTAAVTVTGVGYYVGSVTKNFTIDYETISLNSEKTAEITSAGAMRYYSFTPAANTDILFYCIEEAATCCVLYDENLTQLAADEGEEGFKLIESLTADKTYVLACGYADSDATGTFRARLEQYRPATEMSTCEITLSNSSYTFDNTAKLPSVTVKDGGTVLAENTDYTLTYADNTCVGTASVTVTGIGNYTGSVIKSFSITCDALTLDTPKAVSISTPGDVKYLAFTPTRTMTVAFFTTGDEDTRGYFYNNAMSEMDFNDDYDGESNFKIISHVTAGKTYILKCELWRPDITGSFSVCVEQYVPPRPLSGCTVSLSQSVYTYDGKEKKPTVTIKDGDATVSSEYYTVTYDKNVEVGTATATVKGRNRYTGTEKLYYVISDKTYTFTVSDLTYSFTNDHLSFQYPMDYTIPYERYSFIYGNNARARSIYKKSSGVWSGSCYGMSAVASILTTDVSTLKPADFGKSNVPALTIDDTESVKGLTVKQILESMQIAQFSGAVPAERSENMVYDSNDVTKLNSIRDAAQNVKYTGKPIILCLYGQIRGQNSGHAIVAYDVQNVSATQQNILVYDPNYAGVSKTVQLTLDGNGNVIKWHYKLNGSYDWGTDYQNDKISFCTFDRAMGVYNGSEKKIAYNTLTVSEDTFTVYYADGTTAAVVRNGDVITDNPEIIEIEPIGVTADDQIVKSDFITIQLPVGQYKVVNDENTTFTATMVSLDRSTTVTTSADTVTFTVDDSRSLNEAVVYTDAGDTYDIVLESTANLETGEVAVSGVANGDAVSTAQDNGTITLNNCAGADVSVNGKSLDNADGLDISDASVTLDATVYTYDGTAKQPAVTVTLDGKQLEKDTDYLVMYSDNTDAGAAAVTVRGINSYSGSKTAAFKIKKRDIGNALAVLSDLSFVYDGTAHTPHATVTDGDKLLVEGTDYTLNVTDNIGVGTASVTVTGTGNYIGAVRTTFVILEQGMAGDVNGDGKINIRDVTALQRILAEYQTLGADRMVLADADGDGEITVNDASRIQSYLAEYAVKIV